MAVDGVEMTTYTTCPSCGISYPIGSQHDCPTHIRPSVLIVVAGILMLLLAIGFSCNVQIEIKQKPSSENHE